MLNKSEIAILTIAVSIGSQNYFKMKQCRHFMQITYSPNNVLITMSCRLRGGCERLPLTEPGFLMTPFQTFADEDLADPAAAHGDALVGQVGDQPIQGPAGKGQAQLGGPGQGRGDDSTALLGRIGRRLSGAHVLFQPVQTACVEAVDPEANRVA